MAEIPPAGGLLLRVFTHPACSGCTAAVKQAWDLSQTRPEIELRTVSLVNEEGLQEARTERVTTIPTLILSGSEKEEIRRWVGTPAAGDLESGIREALIS
jgi:hypothetical protein